MGFAEEAGLGMIKKGSLSKIDQTINPILKNRLNKKSSFGLNFITLK